MEIKSREGEKEEGQMGSCLLSQVVPKESPLLSDTDAWIGGLLQQKVPGSIPGFPRYGGGKTLGNHYQSVSVILS